MLADISEYTLQNIETGSALSHGQFKTVEKLFNALGYELDVHLMEDSRVPKNA